MIIAVMGPAGSGKDTAAAYIEKLVDGIHVSGGDILRDMLRTAGLDPKKSALGDFGTFVRKHYGVDAILLKVLEKADDGKHIVNSGSRSPAEARLIHEHGGKIIYINAPDTLRYERIAARNRGDEVITVASLRKQDEQEYSSTRKMAENLDTIKGLADDIVENDGTFDDLYKALDKVVASYTNLK